MGCQATVIPGERADDWESHRAGIVASLGPVDELEAEVVDRIAQLTWRLRRVLRYETGVLSGSIPSITALQVETQRLLAKVQPSKSPDEKRRELEREEERLVGLERLIQRYREFRMLPHDSPIAGNEGMLMLADAYRLDPGMQSAYFYTHDPEFLSKLGIPAENKNFAEGWAGWTCGTVNKGMELIGARISCSAETLLDTLIESLNRDVVEQTVKVSWMRGESGGIPLTEKSQREGATEKEGADVFSPVMDPATIDKIIRYESHLSRQLALAMELFYHLQSDRNEPGDDVETE